MLMERRSTATKWSKLLRMPRSSTAAAAADSFEFPVSSFKSGEAITLGYSFRFPVSSCEHTAAKASSSSQFRVGSVAAFCHATKSRYECDTSLAFFHWKLETENMKLSAFADHSVRKLRI